MVDLRGYKLESMFLIVDSWGEGVWSLVLLCNGSGSLFTKALPI